MYFAVLERLYRQATIESSESTESQLDSLRAEFKELKTLLQVQAVPESSSEVHAVSSKSPPPPFPPPPTMSLLWIHFTLAKEL